MEARSFATVASEKQTSHYFCDIQPGFKLRFCFSSLLECQARQAASGRICEKTRVNSHFCCPLPQFYRSRFRIRSLSTLSPTNSWDGHITTAGFAFKRTCCANAQRSRQCKTKLTRAWNVHLRQAPSGSGARAPAMHGRCAPIRPRAASCTQAGEPARPKPLPAGA